MENSRCRRAVIEALQVAGAFGQLEEAKRKAYVDEGAHLDLSELELDSLGKMEFCIAIELSLGVTVLPGQLAELGSTEAIERYIGERLG